MDAAPLLFTDLITTPSYRLVIPVYQRPYSWDEEQCTQLWEDILSVGRRQGDKHFTGSVVWIQDGTASASGLTPRLVIDGQQRVTTLMLLFVALAEFARAHPERELGFSFDEILGAGYLVNPYRKGEDYYKLTLSKGDRRTLFSIIDHLVNPDVEIDASSSRIISNLAFFQKGLEALENPDIVWEGIRRLEIVSVSLTQGQDNPQLIFESMNSTGKDLSSADLIRNYVLMTLPLDEQESLYSNYWRKIEETLGSDVYDSIFDDFIRNYLSVLKAPESLVKRDVYSEFKKHVIDNRYDKEGRIVELLQEIKRYAQYYAAIAFGKESDEALHSCFSRIARLKITVVNPLLLSLYSDYEGGAFDRDDFIAMLCMIESYLLRRSVCNYATNGLNKFSLRSSLVLIACRMKEGIIGRLSRLSW